MTVLTGHVAQDRPPSPWRGSEHHEQHRWQLDHAPDLPSVAAAVRVVVDELSAAHAAGWWLSEPMRSGHLHAARPFRRRRARPTGDAPPTPRRHRPRWISSARPAPGGFGSSTKQAWMEKSLRPGRRAEGSAARRHR